MIEQAIYGSQDAGGYRFLAHSPGFGDDWLAEAERLCTGFGERPAGVGCPGCVFARPFGRRQVAVVQAADQGADDAGRPGALAFRLLVLPRALYAELGGDPFFLADAFPPPWAARGVLPSLSAPAATAPRTAAALRKVLDVANSATLLGGAQALLDGGRLVFERPGPDDSILRSLWALLPTQERGRLWPASFAFGNAHRFDVLVVPRAAGPEYDDYITEEKVGDYPEGRYECNLQSAVETGDQREIDSLLGYDRSRSLRLIVLLLVLVLVLAAAMSYLLPERPPEAPPTNTSPPPTAPPDLPAADECPALSQEQRTELAASLKQLGGRLGLRLSGGTSDAELSAGVEELDRRLGTPDPTRSPGPLRRFGPMQRQLRALLWKHGVASYNERGLNTDEMVERLRQQLERQGKLKEGVGDG